MEQFFYLHDVNFWLSCFGPSFRYNLVTIGVLEFVVVIDVYAQPTREKIKFYRTASYSGDPEESVAGLRGRLGAERLRGAVAACEAVSTQDSRGVVDAVLARYPDL